MSSIIVFNLPNTITKNDLREVFVNKGNVTNVQLIFTVNTKYCYFALISYQTEDEAIAAQSYFDKTYIFSKRIIVERCSEIVNERDVDNTKNPKNTVLSCSLDRCNSSFVDQSHKKTSTDEVFNINTSETLVKNTESKSKPKLETANMTPKCAKLTLFLTSEESSRTSQKHIENSNMPEGNNKVDMQYKNIIQEFEQLSSLSFGEVISSLIVDKTSDKHTSHILFVKSILIVSLRCNPNNINEVGTLFTELLSKNILYMADITEGIDTFLKDHNEYSENSQFFPNIAACVAQLLISKTASFEFHNLKDAFISLKPNKSTIFFFEVLKNILNFDKSIKIHNNIIWLYEKWWLSECIHFDIFMSYNLVNEYYKINDVGVFLLSMIMYNKMKLNNDKLLYDIMHNWINTCIKEEVVKCPHFIQALTITIILTSATKFRLLGNDNISFEDFIDGEQAKLLTQYISYVQCERYAREFQCMYGIQMMSVTLKYPRDMVLKLCWKLCHDYNIISEESYDFFNDLQNIIFFEKPISIS